MITHSPAETSRTERFAQDNKVLDRANEILEAHRGILPPMTWDQALAQARRQTKEETKAKPVKPRRFSLFRTTS
jgi:hypothetical protein